MKIEIEIKDEDVIDVLTTALEGGSNYWYYLPHLQLLENKELPLVERIYQAIRSGKSIPVADIETNEFLGLINEYNIQSGIQEFVNNGGTFDPAMDADDADNLFQYIVLGKIIYG